MSSDLKSYVEKYLLNPAASFNVDEDGNEETKAQVVDALLEEEKADTRQQSISKLRARRAALEAERDPRYRGKTVLRKDLKKEDVDFDPDLAKLCMVEASEEEDQQEEMEEDDDYDEEENDIEYEDIEKKELQKSNNLSKQESDDDDDDDDDDDGEDYEDNEVKKLYNVLQSEQKGVRFVDDGDFSKFADDMDDEDDKDDDDDDDEDDEDDDEEKSSEEEDISANKTTPQENTLKKFLHDDPSDEVKRGQGVKNQLAIYDSLFEGRICMQKVVSATNQLPQHNTFKLFVHQRDPNYLKNLTQAKVATKNLLSSLLQIQELLLRQNPDTNHIVTGNTPKDKGTESDEEITSSSEGEAEEAHQNDSAQGFQRLKRKMKAEEFEEVLKKRHAAVLPFRDQTINKWYEKTKLLSSHSARGNRFSGFETSALQQLHNILTNKEQLIRRTQLTGTTRGSTYHVLGQSTDDSKLESEDYDPEIYDDTDFYSRALEDVLKAKVSLSDNMTDVSRKWIEIQNLRRKAKKKVDKKASKGRKIRYEVMSKLQQYMAATLPPQMDDAAINTLFASLFGKAIHREPPATNTPH